MQHPDILFCDPPRLTVLRISLGDYSIFFRVCQHEKGILIKDIIAFGDEVNDMEMLKLVGLGIAMENADDVVKEAADRVAGNNDQDGVGKELEKIFGNAGK